MGKLYFSIFLNVIIALSNIAFAEVAVIPYQITSPAIDFPVKTGIEYAKLIATVAAVKKGIPIHSPSQMEIVLKKLSLDTQKTITEQDLHMLCKSAYLDYLLLGTLSRVKGSYISNSILYSVNERRIVARSNVKSGNLLHLSIEDMKTVLFRFPNKTVPGSPNNCIDASILIDLSFPISREWKSIKKGILKFSNTISDNYSADLRMYLIPFSDSYVSNSGFNYLSSQFKIRNALNHLQPKGSSNTESLEKALAGSINSTQRREKSGKIIVIISNSNFTGERFVEKFAVKASRMGIKIYTLSLGLMNRNSSEIMRQLSVIGKGIHYSAAYHQRIYNHDGTAIQLFMEAGRFFYSGIHNVSWAEGLFDKSGGGRLLYSAKPDPLLNEIFYNDVKYDINPYNMSNYYPQLSGSKIIKSEELQNNIINLMELMGNAFLNNTNLLFPGRAFGRALLSDGKISFWVTIKDPKVMDFLSKKKSLKYFFPLGIYIQKKSDEPYGITLNPYYLITELTDGNIPDLIKATLEDIVKRSNYYMSNGLFTPPIWFVKVRVEHLKRFKKVNDIRY